MTSVGNKGWDHVEAAAAPAIHTIENRSHYFETAAQLVDGQRAQDYGDALENFTRIGELFWPILKGWDSSKPVPASTVALLLAQLKIARLVHTPTHVDSWVDGVAYLGLGGELAQRERRTA